MTLCFLGFGGKEIESSRRRPVFDHSLSFHSGRPADFDRVLSHIGNDDIARLIVGCAGKTL